MNEGQFIPNKDYFLKKSAEDRIVGGLRSDSPMQPANQVVRDSVLRGLLEKYRNEFNNLRDSVHEFIARTSPVLNVKASSLKGAEKDAAIAFGSPLASEVWASIVELKALRETVCDATAALEI